MTKPYKDPAGFRDHAIGLAVLEHLAGSKYSLTSPDLAAIFVAEDVPRMRRIVDHLRADGLVESLTHGSNALRSYRITGKGRRSLGAQGGAVAQPRTVVGTGHYDGAELRRPAGRPGAFAAFTLPSLLGRAPSHLAGAGCDCVPGCSPSEGAHASV